MQRVRCFALAASLLLVVPLALATDRGDSAESAPLDELAIELMNPIGRLASLASTFSRERFDGQLPGAGGRHQGSYVLTPVFPFPLSSGKRIVARASIPISLVTPTYELGGQEYADWLIRQRAESIGPDGHFFNGHGHLDDVSFDVAYGGTRENGFLWMAGLAGVLSTSEDLSVAREQDLLGPEVAVGKIHDWGIIGVWARHLVNLSDATNAYVPGDYDTRESRIRLFFAYGLGNGWHLVSNPEIVYDWEGAPDNRLLLPLGGGVSKTLKVGRWPVKLDIEAYTYVQSPEAFGPDWQVRFSFTPVLPNGLSR